MQEDLKKLIEKLQAEKNVLQEALESSVATKNEILGVLESTVAEKCKLEEENTELRARTGVSGAHKDSKAKGQPFLCYFLNCSLAS
jgi:predicted nuclease with TOPRIM domain